MKLFFYNISRVKEKIQELIFKLKQEAKKNDTIKRYYRYYAGLVMEAVYSIQ